MGKRLLILQLQEQELLPAQPTWRRKARSCIGWEAPDPPAPGAGAPLCPKFLERQGEELSWVGGS